jgi:hypothetical protein
MSTFNIIASALNNQYAYENENVMVQGSYVLDATNNGLQSVSGSVYKNNEGQQGDFIGNFNGYVRDGEVRYSLSEMSRRDANLTWGAIDEIEANITGANEE